MRYHCVAIKCTVDLADDISAAVEKVRRERGIGLSAAVNELARAGLAHPTRAVPFRQRTHKMGAWIDVSNVADALETLETLKTLEGPTGR